MREIVNALLYYVKNGCTWRDLPHDLPPWSNVNDHFRRWKKNGLLERIHDTLREEVREAQGREPRLGMTPSGDRMSSLVAIGLRSPPSRSSRIPDPHWV
jgi:transposase